MEEWTTGGDGCLRRVIVHPVGVPLHDLLTGMAKFVMADVRTLTVDGDYSSETTIEIPTKGNPNMDALIASMVGMSIQIKEMMLPGDWEESPMAKWLVERRFPGSPPYCGGAGIDINIDFREDDKDERDK
jgi:hypothetical protein